MCDIQCIDAVNPHHRRSSIPYHASRATGIAGRDDGRQVANVHLAFEYDKGDRAADHRRGDVVQKRRDKADEHQEHKSAFPVVGEIIG